jgi:uncharacterized membrane protein YphA (DoxX/SURF4 family)
MENGKDLSLVSFVARLGMALYVSIVGLNAFVEGHETFIYRMDAIFQAAPWIPSRGVRLVALVLPYLQILLGACLLLGVKLRLAWACSALLVCGLSGAVLAIGRYDIAAAFITYLILACVGLYAEHADNWRIVR